MKNTIYITLVLLSVVFAAEVRLLPVGCTNNADCPNGRVCNTNTGSCVGCLQFSDCPIGLICNDAIQQCKRPCQFHQQCGFNAYCNYTSTPPSCVPKGCVHNGDCQDRSDCVGGYCTLTNPCSTQGECLAGEMCDIYLGQCVYQHDSCTADSDCPSGEICLYYFRECGIPCADNSQCPNENTYCDTYLRPNVCRPRYCIADSDCGSTSSCSNGRCRVV